MTVAPVMERSTPLWEWRSFRVGLKITHAAAAAMTALSLAAMVIFLIDFSSRINQHAARGTVTAELARLALMALSIGLVGSYVSMFVGDLMCAFGRTEAGIRKTSWWIVGLAAAPFILFIPLYFLFTLLRTVFQIESRFGLNNATATAIVQVIATPIACGVMILARRILFIRNMTRIGALARDRRPGSRWIVASIGLGLICLGVFRLIPYALDRSLPDDPFAILTLSLLLLGGAATYHAGLVWLVSGTIAILVKDDPAGA